jgi:hypothetical protein
MEVDNLFSQIHIGGFPDFSGAVWWKNGRPWSVYPTDTDHYAGGIALLEKGPVFFEPIRVHIGDVICGYVELLFIGPQGRQGSIQSKSHKFILRRMKSIKNIGKNCGSLS